MPSRQAPARAADAWRRAARQPALERLAVVRSEHPAGERVDRAGPVTGTVSLDRGGDEVAHELRLVGRRRDGTGRLHQRERGHRVREVEGELERDHRARGVADDVRPVDAELAHQERAVLGVGRHGHGTRRRVAGGEAGAVVAQDPEAVGKGGLAHQRLAPRRAQPPVDQHDGVSPSPLLVLELETVDGCSLQHGIAP
jgi:hypothetical protein